MLRCPSHEWSTWPRYAPRILVLSMHASEGYVAQALRAGVHGYLLKDLRPASSAPAVSPSPDRVAA